MGAVAAVPSARSSSTDGTRAGLPGAGLRTPAPCAPPVGVDLDGVLPCDVMPLAAVVNSSFFMHQALLPFMPQSVNKRR